VTRRTALALVLVAFGAGAVGVAKTFGAAASDRVTLRVEPFWSEACRCHKFRFSGAISSGAPNEYVAVLQQRCGTNFSTSIAGVSTREGGFWEVESNGPLTASSTFRARWNGHLSDPVTHRGDVPIWLTQLGKGRVSVDVTTSDTTLKLKGRFVELQRLSLGQWTRIRRARFVPRRGSGLTRFSATFTVRKRGLTLRAFVPAESAAPCYAATASKTWTSGATTRAGADRVIDQTYACSVGMQGGIRELSVGASGLVPTELTPRRSFGVSSSVPDGGRVWANTDSVTLSPAGCTPSKTRIPLVARGLEGGSVGASRRSFECETPPRVLVRIRAVFTAPTTFQEDRTWGYRQLVAHGEVTKASLAVRAPSGKPFAFASLSRSGPVRLFVARACVEDS
jgi:hypothetical protein